MGCNFIDLKITKKKPKSYKIQDLGSSISIWVNWTQAKDIRKLFEKNSQTLIQKTSLESKFKAYVLYKKCFCKLDGSGGLGPLTWI